MIKPTNKNVLVSIVESYQSDHGFEYNRDSEFDHMLNTETCCRIEAIPDDAVRLHTIQLPVYFMAMKGELFEIEGGLYMIKEERIKGLLTEPLFKNNFSNNLRKMHGSRV